MNCYRWACCGRLVVSFGILSCVRGAEEPVNVLPLTLSLTRTPFDNPPEYFGGGAGNPYRWVDFPICPVMIDGEYWVLYKNGDIPTVFRWQGNNIENGKRQPDGTATFPVRRPYILGGVWYDASEKKLYAPLHCEYYDAYGQMERQIHLATSMDKGLTWRYEGPIVTRDDPRGPHDAASEFSGRYWHGGDGDFLLYGDSRGGYIYLFAGTYVWPKKGVPGRGFSRHHVARCAIADKMMPGKWRRFYEGSWKEPGLGGKASYVNAYCVIYNSQIGKYIGFNYGSSLTVCSDLSKQDWTPCFKIPGDTWGCNGVWAWHVTESGKKDIFTAGNTMFLYSYWKDDGRQAPTQRYRLDFAAGSTPDYAGYSPASTVGSPITSASPMTFYPCEPLFESADRIESRRTRRVNCTNSETAYSGSWDNADSAGYGESRAKESRAPGSTVEFSFSGSEVYWRAVKGPDCGKADVFIDGRLHATVDCYAQRATPDQFALIEMGLASNQSHTIRVVVRPDKNPLSKGTAIRHLLFEYSADSYRASDGFSSIKGKNQWYYQQREGEASTDLTFDVTNWVGGKRDAANHPVEVGLDFMVPGTADAVRKWVAPRAGTVRVEGRVILEGPDKAAVQAMILLDNREVWPPRTITKARFECHDLSLTARRGDSISFIVRLGSKQASDKVLWDPVVTYLDTAPAAR